MSEPGDNICGARDWDSPTCLENGREGMRGLSVNINRYMKGNLPWRFC
jgi:hypothetical protein